jgi:Tfp pilus assembly protein FimT
MASPKTSTRNLNSGFTLLEMCMVVGLLAITGSLGLFMGMEILRGAAFRNDRDAAVSALQRARSLAVNDMCFGASCTEGKPYGVHFDPGKKEVVIFQGASYSEGAATNEAIPFDSKTVGVDASSAVDGNIVFDRLSGDLITFDSATSTSVILTDGLGHNSVIEVNSEGRIDWTN